MQQCAHHAVSHRRWNPSQSPGEESLRVHVVHTRSRNMSRTLRMYQYTYFYVLAYSANACDSHP